MTKKTGSDCYVVIAIDESYQVCECIVVTSLPLATELYEKLRKIWDGDKVYMAARSVDNVPNNLTLNARLAPMFRGKAPSSNAPIRSSSRRSTSNGR